MKKTVSIITVNFNGRKYLKDFLHSAYSLNFDKSKYEVLVVDNASTDDSVQFIQENYPQVKIIKANKNVGFGGGNNLALRNVDSEFSLLVNNDTVMDNDCLLEMIGTYKKWSKRTKIAAVNAKLVLFDKYFALSVKGAYFHDYMIVNENKPFNKAVFVLKPVNKDVFIMKENYDYVYKEKVLIPVANDLKNETNVSIILHKQSKKYFELNFERKKSVSLVTKGTFLSGENSKKQNFNIRSSYVKNFKFDLIQNAGNFIFRDGYGRDRGVDIYGGKQYYEQDIGQYDKEEYVPAFCGAGVLINNQALKRVGFFDESFFMYYEDLDLSLRFKEKGYKVLYCPKALIRHRHAVSSKEWSPFFVFNAERGRLLFVIKHWPRSLALWYFLKYLIKDTVLVPFYHLFFAEFKESLTKLYLRLKVIFSLFYLLPVYLIKNKRLNFNQIKSFT